MENNQTREALLPRIEELEQEVAKCRKTEEEFKFSEDPYRCLFENIPEEIHFRQLFRDNAGLINNGSSLTPPRPLSERGARPLRDQGQKHR